MGNVKGLKNKFENAQRSLVQILFDTSENNHNAVYIQMALDRMRQAFYALLIHTLDVVPETTPPQAQEILCAHAINRGNEWTGSCWQVSFVNGNLIPESERLSVADFTKRMLNDGWKTVSPAGCPSTLQAPDGEPVALLYFCRKPSDSESPWLIDRPSINNFILNSN